MKRKTWHQSWTVLKKLGVALLARGVRPLGGDLERPSEGDADFRGLRLADRVFEETDLVGLTLPRSLVERCRFQGVSLSNTDLMLSCLAGNDWIDCDFSHAQLPGANLRRSRFFACRFTGAALIGCDLREATFEHCDFAQAVLTGARIDRTLKQSLGLDETQREFMVDWWSPEDEEEE